MSSVVSNIRSSGRYNALVVQADQIAGIHIPFISFVPNREYSGEAVLMFQYDPFDTFSDSIDFITKTVFDIAASVGFKGPVIVPVLPSKKQFCDALSISPDDMIGDSKFLCRMCFSDIIPVSSPFYRLDRQIDRILHEVKIPGRFIGFGDRLSALSLMRYSMISPEYFSKIIIGNHIDCIPILSGEHGQMFDYPLGVRDRDILFGKSYSDDLFRGIDYEFYFSKNSDFSALDLIHFGDCSLDDICPSDLARYYCDQYGRSVLNRFRNAMQDYESSFLNTHLKLYDDDFRRFIPRYDFQEIVYKNQSFEEFPVRQMDAVFPDSRC